MYSLDIVIIIGAFTFGPILIILYEPVWYMFSWDEYHMD